MKTIPHLPAIRHGRAYESLDTVELWAIGSTTPVATVSQLNAGLIRRDISRLAPAHEVFAGVSTSDLIGICGRAAHLFLEESLPTGLEGYLQGPEEYVAALSATTGLPYALCRSNMLKIVEVLTQMETILKGLTRGLNNEIFDRGYTRDAGIEVCFAPQARALGVVLPSNSPGVNSLWLPALAMRVPVLLKPGREDPWTPLRIIQALAEAGCPREAMGYYPAGHEGGEAIVSLSDRALVFGGDATVKRFAGNPAVQIHGAGRSKVLIGADQADRWEEFIDVLFTSIAANSGRSCINASAILTPGHGDAMADALAARLAAIEPGELSDEGTQLAGFANPAIADSVEQMIASGLATPGARDFTAGYRQGPIRRELNGLTYLLPTLVVCQTMQHPLANTELLFPYAAVIEIPQEEMLTVIGPTLVATAITEDTDWIRELMRSREIDRVNLGLLPTTQVQWDQLHEGHLFEFLYRRRAFLRQMATVHRTQS